jgi:class 3 adenylate cyclase
MEPAIIENHGFVDKYLGDGIMALFDGAADNAVMAAFSMLHQLTSYNQTRQRPDRPPLNIGIGINTGSVMLGTVGSKRRMDSTTIGNTVNLAARLEELTKIYGASLLISRETFFELENFTEYSFRLIDHTTVRGKLEPVTVYEIFDADPPELCEAKSDTKSTFESAILQFHARRYHDAGALFQACIDRNPNDRPAQAYLSRCLAESGVTQLIKKEN